MGRDDFRDWVEGYIRAWASNDPREIGALFAQDATYSTGPWDAPWSGREEIVTGWLTAKDEPDSWTFQYDVIAVDRDLGVVEGETVYTRPTERTYRNLWLIRLDETGQATSFTEWWVRRPD